MKNGIATVIILLTLTILRSNAQPNRAETMKEFLKDFPALTTETITTIDQLVEISTKKASKNINLTKDNINEALTEAKGKSCIIVLERHTFVKFSDVSKCAPSSSWSACMPYGEGYIQNGALKSVDDHINNIIGKPDTQNRTLFIF